MSAAAVTTTPFDDLKKQQPHAVCVPFPFHGDINSMLKLAKVLHHKGFHITFVNTDFNHRRFIKSKGAAAEEDTLKDLPSFRFESIPDGLPPSAPRESQDNITLLRSTADTCLAPFRELLLKLNGTVSVPPVSCIISDFPIRFTFVAAEEIGVPGVCYWGVSACFAFVVNQAVLLTVKGYLPLKDENLNTVIEDIPLMKGMRLRDLPDFKLTLNTPSDLEFIIREEARIRKASGFIINSFEEFESDYLDALRPILPSLYAIGPLNLLVKQAHDHNKDLEKVGLNQWNEEIGTLDWLDSKEPNSVIYVNFGSSTFLTPDQLVELAWGLANSNQNFLWVIRPNLILGESAVLPSEFIESTKERGMVAGWCPQEKVLAHSSIGGFLTHSGWNSILESICCGVPMICWPFFADQPTNSWSCCTKWGIGMKMNNGVKRDEVERLVTELLIGEKGQEMKRRVKELMNLANHAAKNSSLKNLDKVIDQVLLQPRRA